MTRCLSAIPAHRQRGEVSSASRTSRASIGPLLPRRHRQVRTRGRRCRPRNMNGSAASSSRRSDDRAVHQAAPIDSPKGGEINYESAASELRIPRPARGRMTVMDLSANSSAGATRRKSQMDEANRPSPSPTVRGTVRNPCRRQRQYQIGDAIVGQSLSDSANAHPNYLARVPITRIGGHSTSG